MKTNRWLWFAGVALIAGLTAVTGWQRRVYLETKEENSALAARVRAGEAALSKANAAVKQLESNTGKSPVPFKKFPVNFLPPALEAKLAEIRARQSNLPLKPAEPPPPSGARDDVVFPELMGDAAYAHLYRRHARLELEADYALLFATLRVPPATSEKLRELLLDRQVADLDAEDTVTRTGFDSLREAREKVAGEIDREIHALLGDEAFAEFTRYDKAVPQRVVINALSKRLSYEDVALDARQTLRLVEVFSETWTDEERTSSGRIILNDTFMKRAQPFLSPTQWERAKAFQAEQRAMKPRS